MPCGLPSAAARANVVAARRVPDRNPRPSRYSNTRSAASSTTHTLRRAAVGSIVIPVGEPFRPSSRQLPRNPPDDTRYTNTLSVVAAFTTHTVRPSVARSCGLALPLRRANDRAAACVPVSRPVAVS
jgi:hypothetical protein